MDLRPVDTAHLPVYRHLAQAYEAEFSALTGKMPGEDGVFALDTEIDEKHLGWLLYEQGRPVGLAAIGSQGAGWEVCEFYVLPVCRGRSLGSDFIHEIWRRFPGEWQIKQIAGAELASRFWRRCIAAYPLDFKEDIYEDVYWGRVTRQRFTLSPST
jgi:predicted acetyltransferase